MNTHNPRESGTKNSIPGETAQPDADLHTPDANVGLEGECIVPAHPESVRQGTGEPCDDGRGGTQK